MDPALKLVVVEFRLEEDPVPTQFQTVQGKPVVEVPPLHAPVS